MDSSSPKMKTDRSVKPSPRYYKSWEDLPQFKGWLSGLPGDPGAAFCKICQRPLHPHKTNLIEHARTKKHLRNVENFNRITLNDGSILDYDEMHCPKRVKTEPIDADEVDSTFKIKNSNDKNITIEVFPASAQKSIKHNVRRIVADAEDDQDQTEDEAEFDSFTITDNQITSSSSISRPIFKDWLMKDGDQLSCRVCDRQLKKDKSAILRHSSGKVHQMRCDKMGIKSDSKVVLAHFLPEDESFMKIFDLRSDSTTLPTDEMKEAMNKAVTEDSGQDSLVRALEEKVASLFEKEAALFLPTGTMANLIAVMSHCRSNEAEVLLGDESHLYQYSLGAITSVAGVECRPLKTKSDGTFNLEVIERMVKSKGKLPWPVKTLVCVENTHNRLGGLALPMKWLNKLGEFCEENDVLLHMDGARLLNAALAVGESPCEIAKHCHSVTLCLNKGLGCPLGSMLVGRDDLIKKAEHIRNMLGGHIAQNGLFAAAGIYSLDHMPRRLFVDHSIAMQIAKEVDSMHSSAVWVKLSSVMTNIVILHTDIVRVNANTLCDRLNKITSHEFESMEKNVRVLCLPISDGCVRLMTHSNINKAEVIWLCKKLRFVIEEYDNTLNLDLNKELLH